MRRVKPATIRDVAERARVSVASVSRVLTGAGAVTEPTRLKVLEAVDALARYTIELRVVRTDAGDVRARAVRMRLLVGADRELRDMAVHAALGHAEADMPATRAALLG